MAELTSALLSGIVSVSIVVAIVPSRCSSTARTFSSGGRRLLPPQRQAQADQVGGVMYRTLGRYFGGSITVAILMGLYVLALGLVLGIPLAPLAAIWVTLTDLIPQVGGFLGGCSSSSWRRRKA